MAYHECLKIPLLFAVLCSEEYRFGTGIAAVKQKKQPSAAFNLKSSR